MTVLKDALYYLHPESGVDPATARGVLIGVIVATIHARRCTFADAAKEVKKHLPDVVRPECIPPGWEVHFSRGAIDERNETDPSLRGS
jgi:hypothetical protein